MKHILSAIYMIAFTGITFAQQRPFTVYGYFLGRPELAEKIPVEKLTHLSFSFTHLKGDKIALSTARDTLSLLACMAQKKRNPNLKLIISMGGWGGCYSCSEVFGKDVSRKIFASSVKQMLSDYNADGIDLDWEYPTIPGHPGHPYSVNDRTSFTALVQTLRDTLGKSKEISFAAGGFPKFIEESVDWKAITPLVDRINIMTYDLVHGYDTVTGHHTPLYSTSRQTYSCDNAIKMLLQKGVPAEKLVIGAAFYGRIWEDVAPVNNGLYQKGKFLKSAPYKNFNTQLSADSGFVYHWDNEAHAPYLYNAGKKWFVTFDDRESIALKTKYALAQKLDGIMFWQLGDDDPEKGLLDAILSASKKRE
jgi:chitinase